MGGASHVTVRVPSPRETMRTPLTGFGGVSGTTGPASELGSLVPMPLVASTVNQYCSPSCRPPMVQGDAEQEVVVAPGPRPFTE